MKGDQMGILAAYPTQRELPLSNQTWFNPSPRERPLSNQTRFSFRTGCRKVRERDRFRAAFSAWYFSYLAWIASPVQHHGITKRDRCGYAFECDQSGSGSERRRGSGLVFVGFQLPGEA